MAGPGFAAVRLNVSSSPVRNLLAWLHNTATERLLGASNDRGVDPVRASAEPAIAEGRILLGRQDEVVPAQPDAVLDRLHIADLLRPNLRANAEWVAVALQLQRTAATSQHVKAHPVADRNVVVPAVDLTARLVDGHSDIWFRHAIVREGQLSSLTKRDGVGFRASQGARAIDIRANVIRWADEQIVNDRGVTILESEFVTGQHILAQRHGWHTLHQKARARSDGGHAGHDHSRARVAEDGLLVVSCATRITVVAVAMRILETLLGS
jgi:hypothetical protein